MTKQYSMNSAPKIEDILDPSYFQSIEISFDWVKNITTRTEVEDASECTVVEYSTNTLTAEFSRNIASTGHKIMFQLTIKIPGEHSPLVFDATTRVSATELMDDGQHRILLTLVQYEEKSWKHFLETVENRQKEINNFFAMVKG